jgi:hypothetical protein
MRRKGYILATDFPSQIRKTISNVIDENYQMEVNTVISKANHVLEVAKTAEKFNKDQELEMEER